MLLTQSYSDLGKPPSMRPEGVYYDEVQLLSERGYGKSILEHIEELSNRSLGKIVINCRIETRPGTSHSSYNTRIVSVCGDLYIGTL